MPLETTSSATHPPEPSLLKRLRRTRRLITHDLAIEEVDRAVGMASITRVVRDHTDRRTPLVQLPQQLHHRLTILRVEVTRRLIGKEDQGLAGDRTCTADARRG